MVRMEGNIAVKVFISCLFIVGQTSKGNDGLHTIKKTVRSPLQQKFNEFCCFRPQNVMSCFTQFIPIESNERGLIFAFIDNKKNDRFSSSSSSL